MYLSSYRPKQLRLYAVDSEPRGHPVGNVVRVFSSQTRWEGRNVKRDRFGQLRYVT